MKKIYFKMMALIASAMMCLGVNAQGAIEPTIISPSIGVGDAYTSVEALKDVTFAITADGKALYGSGAQNAAFDVYENAFKSTNSGYQWRLLEVNAENSYYQLQLVTPAGQDYAIWGNPVGVLNSQAATGWCSFILNTNQDIPDGSTYEILYVEGQGFTLKNIGTGLYQGADAAPANKETPTYFTLAPVASTYVPALEAMLAEGEAWKAIIDNADAVAAYDEAIAGIGPATTEDAFADAKKVDLAISELVKAQTTAGAIMTRAIVNPSFEQGNRDGWEENYGGNTTGTNNFGKKTGAIFLERWTSSSNNGKLSDGYIKQTITGLPNGKYKLTAEMQNLEQANDPATDGKGYFLVANDARTEVAVAGETVEVTAEVTDGTLTIGAVIEGCTGNWVCVDNFQLTFVEPAAVVPEGPTDVTDLIKNPAYMEKTDDGSAATYAGWEYTTDGWKPRNYEEPMNLITYSGNQAFEVSQTIENIPAGLYKLTVNAFYRAGSIEDETALLAKGEAIPQFLTMYADNKSEGNKYSKKVMNITSGALTENTYETGTKTYTIGEQTYYVPDGASDSRKWYINGKYTNEVYFNVFEDGASVTIGLSKESGLPGDYCPVGAWKLYRVGDADETAATPDEKAPATFAITISETIANGSVVAEPAEAAEGAEVALTVTPAEGYELESLSVVAGETKIEVSEDYVFIMPAAPVTVNATFVEITVAPEENFTLVAHDYIDGVKNSYAQPRYITDDSGNEYIEVTSCDNPSAEWDSQFFITLNDELAVGDKVTLSMLVRATAEGTMPTQTHTTPGNYAGGLWPEIAVSTEWTKYEGVYTVSNAAAKTLVFNLAKAATANSFQFDDITISIEKAPEFEWVDIIKNGDMEGTNVSCFYKTEATVGPSLAAITAGAGNDGSAGIEVQSADGASQSWDTQFFIRLPYILPAGTHFLVEFDYKADKAANIDTQSHGEPGSYKHYACIGNPAATTEWQTYSYEGTVADQADGMYTIAINLAANKVATKYSFDNIKFFVQDNVLPELVASPDLSKKEFTIDVERMATQGYTPSTYEVDLAEAAAFLGVKTITAEMLSIVNPDGTIVSDYAPYDGWFAADGSPINWGDDSKVYVKFFQAIESGTFEVGDMNGADVVGTTYTFKWALSANDKTAIYNINVKFTEFVETVYKPEIAKTIEIEAIDQAGAAYKDASHPTFDVAEVCEALGIEDITTAKTYIVNVTTGNFVENTTDGWRDANGDAIGWADATNGYCLKLNAPATGEFDYNGAHDANFAEGDTYVAQCGLVANEKAVVLKVTIKFLSETEFNTAVAIEGVEAAAAADGKYMVDGKIIIIKNGVKYNVNGSVIK